MADAQIDPTVTPAQAEAAQPGSNEQTPFATGGERLQHAVATGVQQQGFGLGAIYRTLTTGSPLPQLYDNFAQARKAGYSWDEIYQGFDAARAKAVEQGYTPAEVNKAVGLPSLNTEPAVDGSRAVLPPPSAFEEGGIPGHIAGVIRDFAAKYIQPRDPAQAAIDFKPTAGGILGDLGWNVIDAAKVFGRSVVDGAAATAELLDGRKGRTVGDWARLGWEASGFLALFIPGPKGATAEAGAAKAEMTLPPKEDFLDAAISHGDRNSEGLTDNARVLGERYVQTREDPVTASNRIHQDQTAADAFDQRAAQARAAREGGVSLESGFPQAPYVAEGNGGLGALGEFHDHVTGEAYSAMAHDVNGIFQTTAAPGRFARIANEIDNSHTIPYGAGISADGRRVYIDRNLPQTITVKRADGTEAEMDPRKYLAVHESTERAAMEEGHETYQGAHAQHADKAERQIVEADGWDWNDYETKILGEIRKLSEPENATAVPRDLYRKPYVEEGQTDLIERHGRGSTTVQGEHALAEATGAPGGGPALAAGRPSGKAPGAVPAGGGESPEATGRNLVGEFLSSESGAVPMLEYPEIDPQTIRQPPSPLGQGLVDDVVRIFNPAARARVAAGIMREGMARSELGLLKVSNALRRFGRAVGEMPSVDRKAWMDAYETGNLGEFEGTWAGDMARAIHDAFDAAYARMEELGVAPGYIENYLPHIWADPGAARNYFVSRRLEGNKAFTRQRSYQLISQGLQDGLRLVTDDPVELSLLQMQQQQKFIAAHEVRASLEARGLATKIATNTKPPDGLVRLNIAGGEYFAPEQVATLFNRLLSPGLSGRPAYDAIRGMTNLTAQAKLIGSVFHPVVLTVDAVAGQMGLGIKGIGRGVMKGDIAEIGRGLVKIGTSPAAPFINAYKGSRYISEVINGPGADPFRATVADAIISSGGRVQPHSTYHPTASGSFLRVIKGTLSPNEGGRTLGQETVQMFRDAQPVKIGNTTVAPAYVRAMAEWGARALDTISSPIMEVMVPHMKVGAIASEMEDLLRAHPNLGPDDIRFHGGKIVDQVDNRLGEMTYYNMFWNKAVQDVNHVVFLSPGWMLGKLRLMGSVGLDALNGGLVTVGEERELSSNVSYLIGLLGATALTSSVYGYLNGSWNKDWDWRDYLAPPDKNGVRMSLPNFMKDIYGWIADPIKEVENKISPLWSTIGDLASNRQYNGAAITDPRAPWLDQVNDYAEFTGRQFAPLVSQAPSGAEDELSPFERFLGIRQAPYGIREPEKVESFRQRDLRKALRKKERMQ